MKKVSVLIVIMILCSLLVSASTKIVLKVSSDEPVSAKEALTDIKEHPFVLYFKLDGFSIFFQIVFLDFPP